MKKILSRTKLKSWPIVSWLSRQSKNTLLLVSVDTETVSVAVMIFKCGINEYDV